MLQLNSYENRVFQVFFDDARPVVTKFYRPGRWSEGQILEEHAFTNELAAEEIPVAPAKALQVVDAPLVNVSVHGNTQSLGCITTAVGDAFRFGVAECKAGHAPELEDEDTLRWLGRFIGRIHVVGARQPFAHRRELTPNEFGWDCRAWLLEHADIPDEAVDAWSATSDNALQAACAVFESLGEHRRLRLHGDCHVGNILWTDAGPHFVDLDDCLTGPAVQDLWMLLSGDPAAARRQMHCLLDGYEQFMDFDDRELALIEPLRTLRMVHQSAWLARRWSDPAFPVGFPWFKSGAYWQQQTRQLDEQIGLCRSALDTLVR
jgi:Ser/Thr protein kinase RdoA (MazF antagonist)